MATTRQQPQQLALHRVSIGGGQDAAAERDRGVAGQDDLAGRAVDRVRLLGGEPQRIGGGKLGLARGLVDGRSEEEARTRASGIT